MQVLAAKRRQQSFSLQHPHLNSSRDLRPVTTLPRRNISRSYLIHGEWLLWRTVPTGNASHGIFDHGDGFHGEYGTYLCLLLCPTLLRTGKVYKLLISLSMCSIVQYCVYYARTLQLPCSAFLSPQCIAR